MAIIEFLKVPQEELMDFAPLDFNDIEGQISNYSSQWQFRLVVFMNNLMIQLLILFEKVNEMITKLNTL